MTRGFPKKGRESVGVARQYCGQVGKQDNCRVAVSLSVATEKASMPVAFRLYLPETWAQDRKRRKKTGVPDRGPVSNQAANCAGADSPSPSNEVFRRAWCWPMLAMETIPVFARR